MKNYFLILFIVTITLFAESVSATTVETKISNSVNTGGNTVINGESIGGSSKSNVRVYTEIDGEVVEDFEKEVEVEEEFEFKSRQEVSGTKVDTEIKINNGDFDNTEDITDIEVSYQTEEGVQKISFVRKILNYVFAIFKF